MKKTCFVLLTTLFLMFALPVQAQDSGQVLQSRYAEVTERVLTKSVRRYDAYGEFINKLESRRSKLSSQGKDVTELDNSLRLAKVEYNELKATLTAAETRLENLDFSQPQTQLRKTFLDEINTVRKAFRELHQVLITAVRQAKLAGA